MKSSVVIFFCSVALMGRGHAQTNNAPKSADPLTNLPPELAEYAKTPEGQRTLEMVRKMKEQVDRTKYKLIHKTDYQAVLTASREVIRNRRDFRRDPKWHGPSDPAVSLIAPDDPKLPVAIRKLQAASVFAYDDNMRIEFGGGFHHQGFVAYSASFTNTPVTSDGFQKIIDGLWFYEDTK
jgi:hypothetical protein